MRKLFIILLVTFPFKNLMAQWETVYFPPNPKLPVLKSTRFFDGMKGLACGYKTNPIEGVIIKTSNSGTTWDTVLIDNNTSVEKIALLNNSTAIAVAKPINSTTSKAFKTVDGGQTWNSISFPNSSFSSVHFANQTIGLITDINGTVYRSLNSGNTWQTTATISDTLKEVFALSPNKVFIISNRYLYSSNDGGVSWANLYFNSEYLIDITFFDNTTGYILAFNGSGIPDDLYIYKTIDGGNSWNKVSTLLSQLIHSSIYFSTVNKGYIVGQFSTYHTSDGGITWNSQNSSAPSSGNFMDDLSDVHFVSEDTGFICGNYGDFYRLFKQPNSIQSINSFSDFHIYPIPANNKVFITTEDKQINPNTKIIVYNMLGKVIKEEKIITVENPINTTELPNGLYYITIREENVLKYNGKLIIVH